MGNLLKDLLFFSSVVKNITSTVYLVIHIVISIIRNKILMYININIEYTSSIFLYSLLLIL